jgi:flagellar hook-associated protein 3 FlgL
VFTTVQNIVNTLQTGNGTSVDTAKLNNALAAGINNIDQALGSLSNVRASVGARLNTITTLQSVAGTQQVQLQSSISTLQSLDYASAITTLNQQNTTLSAALQAYSLTQNLSLFKYI